jgi:hypothetical protein
MAVPQSMKMLNVPASSREGSLPQNQIWHTSRKNQVGCQAASRSSFAPTGPAQTDLTGVRQGEPGRLLGRLAVDVDLGAPLTTLAEALRSGKPGMDAG